jgi:hypothetical protein
MGRISAMARPVERGLLEEADPREITSTDSIRADTDSAAIRSFARGDSGMVSVGLNADEFVTDTYM